ncbi:MAG: hypothetical protein NC300_08210 [Bacteroidales bacterium]|nr:hypothetical protein [Clostridium sp.]MCM1204114.1 hypothetical protein [Bacteroidales bacterium]
MEIGNTYTGYAAGWQRIAETKTLGSREAEPEDKEEAARKTENAEASEKSQKQGFRNTRELREYLSKTYDTVRRGMVRISGSYLRECLEDETKMQELLDNLKDADAMEKNAKDEVKGYQGMKITIDEEGKMQTETYGGSVAFNEAKRARQLAAAKSVADVQAVMALLNKDLSDCQSGLQSGMCDENEVRKVKAMIAQANKRMSELSVAARGKNQENTEVSVINMLI